MNENLDRLRKLLSYYGNLDKSTVLALIERVEAAEAAVQRVREVATSMATHSLPEAPRGGAWETAHGAQLFAKDILEALDGGEQK